MTLERLRLLITDGESLAVEFKGEEHTPLSDRDLVEAAVCLANRPTEEPGWLLVGVEDDGRITGAHPRHEAGQTDTRRVQALIANRTRPSLSVIAEVVPIEENQAGRAISLDELIVLNGLWLERHLNTVQAEGLIQKPEAEARAVLERLVETGLVESRGERKGRTFHLSAAAYRRLGEKAAYIRQRGFESLQQEQMVLQYVEKHGRITRREAAELCRLGPDQAKRLLLQLVSKEKLKKHGGGKGTWYGLCP